MKHLALLFALSLSPAAVCAAAVPPCEAGHLSLATDTENGAFESPAHSGTLLVLRNLGPGACSLAALPDLVFRSSLNSELGIAGSLAAPAPATPIILPSGAEATATLLWISSNVQDHGLCLSPFFLTAQIGSGEIVAPFQATICGSPKPSYTFTRFATDPVFASPAEARKPAAGVPAAKHPSSAKTPKS